MYNNVILKYMHVILDSPYTLLDHIAFQSQWNNVHNILYVSNDVIMLFLGWGIKCCINVSFTSMKLALRCYMFQ
jgi:hypothetical protein